MQPGEFGWIDWIRQQPPTTTTTTGPRVLVGPGDDCAVLAAPGSTTTTTWLYALDMLLEGTHFTAETPPEAVAYKLLAVNVSDVAAMGGTPRFAVTGVGLNLHNASETLKAGLYTGLRNAAEQFGVALVGGDVTAWPAATEHAGLVLSLALLGEMEPALEPVLRSGARPGDVIAVTGELGGSLLGKHLRFVPRLEPGRFLARQRFATAMIDISDGLASDLGHICRESNVGARVEAAAVPIAAAAHELSRTTKQEPLAHALSDGEDFELCFTVPAARWEELEANWPFDEPALTRIGTIRPKDDGITLAMPDGTTTPLAPTGYDHLRPQTDS